MFQWLRKHSFSVLRPISRLLQRFVALLRAPTPCVACVAWNTKAAFTSFKSTLSHNKYLLFEMQYFFMVLRQRLWKLRYVLGNIVSRTPRWRPAKTGALQRDIAVHYCNNGTLKASLTPTALVYNLSFSLPKFKEAPNKALFCIAERRLKGCLFR